jgi:hypothetical protein
MRILRVREMNSSTLFVKNIISFSELIILIRVPRRDPISITGKITQIIRRGIKIKITLIFLIKSL